LIWNKKIAFYEEKEEEEERIFFLGYPKTLPRVELGGVCSQTHLFLGPLILGTPHNGRDTRPLRGDLRPI
jgi:hypothetical protein